MQANGEGKKFEIPAVQSLTNLQKQIRDLINNLNTLARNNTIGNTLKSLQIAKQRLTEARDNANQTSVIQWVNQTVSTIYNYVNTIQSSANSQGVNTTNCTENTSQDVLGLVYNFTVGIASCPVNEASRALEMINRDIEYVSSVANITTYLPIAINNCYTQSNPRKCLVYILGSNAVVVASAPVKLTSMAAEVSTYAGLFQTNLGICAANSSFAALAEVTQWGVNMTSCIADQMSGRSRN